MSDYAPHPTSDGDSPWMDRALASLGRFTPRPGFERRILMLVRVPLPAWARGLRNWFRSLTSGPRGWAILGSLSVATAAVWVTGIAAGLHFSEYLTRGGHILASDVIPSAWSELLAVGTAQRDAYVNSVAGAFDSLGVSWSAVALAYGAIVVVSAIALRLLMTRPVRANG